MKTVDEHMRLAYKMEMVEDMEAGGFVASFPDVKAGVTCADTAHKAVCEWS